jgi:hypothetical protein
VALLTEVLFAYSPGKFGISIFILVLTPSFKITSTSLLPIIVQPFDAILSDLLIVRDLYSSPSIIRIIKIRRMRWAGHVARMGEKKNAYRLLVGKPEGKRPLGRPRRK